MRNVLPVQRVQHDVTLQLHLMRVRDVLQLAPAARWDVWTRRDDAVRRCLDDSHDLGECRSTFLVAHRHLDLLAGDAALDEHGGTVVVMSEAQSAVDHAPEAHLGYCPESRSRSSRLTSGMSALPPVASLTARIS